MSYKTFRNLANGRWTVMESPGVMREFPSRKAAEAWIAEQPVTWRCVRCGRLTDWSTCTGEGSHGASSCDPSSPSVRVGLRCEGEPRVDEAQGLVRVARDDCGADGFEKFALAEVMGLCHDLAPAEALDDAADSGTVRAPVIPAPIGRVVSARLDQPRQLGRRADFDRASVTAKDRVRVIARPAVVLKGGELVLAPRCQRRRRDLDLEWIGHRLRLADQLVGHVAVCGSDEYADCAGTVGAEADVAGLLAVEGDQLIEHGVGLVIEADMQCVSHVVHCSTLSYMGYRQDRAGLEHERAFDEDRDAR